MTDRNIMQSGFTLIEVLVSLVIISIIITGFYTAFINSNKSVMISKNKSEAFYQAQDILIKAMADPTIEPTKVSLSEDIVTTISFNGTDIEVTVDELEVTDQYKGYNSDNREVSINTYRFAQ